MFNKNYMAETIKNENINSILVVKKQVYKFKTMSYNFLHLLINKDIL